MLWVQMMDKKEWHARKLGIAIKYLCFGVTLGKSLSYISSNRKEDLLHVEICFRTLLEEFWSGQSFTTNFPGALDTSQAHKIY